jgi:hypothetical protein
MISMMSATLLIGSGLELESVDAPTATLVVCFALLAMRRLQYFGQDLGPRVEASWTSVSTLKREEDSGSVT